jgi:hypothetical protein
MEYWSNELGRPLSTKLLMTFVMHFRFEYLATTITPIRHFPNTPLPKFVQHRISRPPVLQFPDPLQKPFDRPGLEQYLCRSFPGNCNEDIFG